MADEMQKPARRRHPRKTILIIASALVVVAAVVITTTLVVSAQAEDQPDPLAVTVPVPLSVSHVPDGMSLGVILTLGNDAEGSEWNQAAQGARVAQQRLKLGGVDLRLDAEDDHGTSEGAQSAVRELVDRGVAGIVIATAGAHVSAAVRAAADAGIPVVLPYASLPSESESESDVENAWSLAPADAAETAALRKALGKAERPLHVDAGAGLPDGFEVADRVAVDQGADVPQLAATLAQRTAADTRSTGAYLGSLPQQPDAPSTVTNDALLITGSPARQAAIVRALQAQNVSVPIVLTGEATSPAFAAALEKQEGSVTPALRTVGAAWGDAAALDTDAAGRAMSAFLAGVRLFAQDDSIGNLTDDAPFSTVAAAADSRSHDAVVALVRASGAAGSDEPGEVASALGEQHLGPQDGLAGPGLDFGETDALTGAVVPLHATAQDLTLRPAGAGGRLVWFTAPRSQET